MPKRRTEDAIHVKMTDHRIARSSVLTEPERENTVPYTGSLRVFLGSEGLLERAAVKQRIDSGRGAEADYRRWVEWEPDSVAARAALGDALMRLGKRAEALPVLERARGSIPALNALAVLHATEGRLDRALALLKNAQAIDPEHPLTLINLGVTMEALGRPDEAANSYREAIRIQPDSAEARRRLAALSPR
jgi:tetratricopeptide (TPR) repeat protein